MKTYLNEVSAGLLLTIDSENSDEARLLHRFSQHGGFLTAGGSSGEVERIQFVTADITLSLKTDIEELVALASNNDQMSEEEYEDLKKIQARMEALGLFERRKIEVSKTELKPVSEYTHADFEEAWLASLRGTAAKLGCPVTEIVMRVGRIHYSTPDGKTLSREEIEEKR